MQEAAARESRRRAAFPRRIARASSRRAAAREMPDKLLVWRDTARMRSFALVSLVTFAPRAHYSSDSIKKLGN